MFNSLRTEAAHWNHLIIPRSMHVFSGFQNNFVQVATIEDRRIQHDLVDGQYLVPVFEIQRVVAPNHGINLTVNRAGQEIELDQVSPDPSLAKTPSWLV